MKKFVLCKLCLVFFGAFLAMQSVVAGNWNKKTDRFNEGLLKDDWLPLSSNSLNDAVINPPEVALPNLKVTKFVLKHGKCGRDDTFDDCSNDRQRIQRWNTEWLPISSAIPKDNDDKNIVFYNFKLFIPSEDLFPFFSIGMNQNIADAKLPAKNSSIWKLVTLERTKTLGVKTDQGRSCSFNPDLVRRNEWLDFQIMANYSLYNEAENKIWPRVANDKRKGITPILDPSFKVWINGTEACELYSPLITKRALNEAIRPELFVKWGIYNTFVSTFLLSQKENRDWVTKNKIKFERYQQKNDRIKQSKGLTSSAIANPFDYDWPVKVPTQILYFSEWRVARESFL